jgi:hypothetical protein
VARVVAVAPVLSALTRPVALVALAVFPVEVVAVVAARAVALEPSPRAQAGKVATLVWS